MKQTTFASLSFQSKKKQTRRDRFLAEMDQVVPCTQLIALIEPHYANKGPTRALSDAASEHAAGLLHAAEVCNVRSGGE